MFIDVAFATIIVSLVATAILRKPAAKRTVENWSWIRGPGVERRVEFAYLGAGVAAIGAGLLEIVRYLR